MRIANDDVGATAGEPPSKRNRTARASERGITWKSLLLAGVAVAVALLGPIALLEVASFGVRFVAKAVATVSQ